MTFVDRSTGHIGATREVTYGQLDDHSRAAAGVLSSRCIPGDRVATGETAPDAVRILAGIPADMAGTPQVAPDDGFFDLGGDRVLAHQAAVRARTHDLALHPKDAFEHPAAHPPPATQAERHCSN
ncbi:hypothetical protein [Streptomyces sp. P9-A2]|uniref:hypothetical protein n=1 Tax=Streptomyces sp. P9-A2 TaxID=3072284 RepID=UPI002FC84EFE